MRPVTVILLVLVCCRLVSAQEVGCGNRSPRELVDSLWKMATLGSLLNSEGRSTAARDFFTDSSVTPDDGTVRVVGNDWGEPLVRTEGNTSLIDMGYSDNGKIDSRLRYMPPKSPVPLKAYLSYKLVLIPEYSIEYAPGVAPLKAIGKKPTGCNVWRIEGSLGGTWATVNTAIRYVLEMRNKSDDPAVRDNADKTIAELLKWP